MSAPAIAERGTLPVAALAQELANLAAEPDVSERQLIRLMHKHGWARPADPADTDQVRKAGWIILEDVGGVAEIAAATGMRKQHVEGKLRRMSPEQPQTVQLAMGRVFILAKAVKSVTTPGKPGRRFKHLESVPDAGDPE